MEGLAECSTERTERLDKQRFTAHLVAASHRYFRDADQERARFDDLIAEDDLLSDFHVEVLLGGLSRSAEEVADTGRRLDAIQAEVTTH